MKTIILPCAGDKLLFGKNILVQRHPSDGKLLLEKTLSGLNFDEGDRIIIVIYNNDDEIVRNINYLRANLINQLELYVLPYKTNDAAETVYLTIKNNNVVGKIIIKDINNSISYSDINASNFIAGISVIEHCDMSFDIRQMGFILLNKTNQVLDVIEKKIVSEYISVGMYGFASSDKFIFAYERLRRDDYPIQKLYINNIITYLIGYNNEVFHYLNVDKFEDWSTDYSWNLIQNKYADCFIDFDTIFESCFKSKSMDYKISSSLLELQLKGCNLIGFTSLPKTECEFLTSELNACKLYFNQIVYNCSFSGTKKIIRNLADVMDLIYKL